MNTSSNVEIKYRNILINLIGRAGNQSDESSTTINNITSTEETAALSWLISTSSQRSKAVFPKSLNIDEMLTANNLYSIGSIRNKLTSKRTNEDKLTTTMDLKLSGNDMSNESEEKENNIAFKTEVYSEMFGSDDVAQEKQQVETPISQSVFTRSNSRCSKQGFRSINRSDESIRGIKNVTSTEETAALSRLESISSERLKAVFSSLKSLSTDSMSLKRTNQGKVTTTMDPKLSNNVMSNESEEKEHNITFKTEVHSELFGSDDVAQEPTPQSVSTRSNGKCSIQGRKGINRSDESIRGINNVTSTEEIVALSRLKSISSERSKAVFSSPKSSNIDSMSTGNNLPLMGSIENKSALKRTNRGKVTTTMDPKVSNNFMFNENEEKEHNITPETEVHSELFGSDDVAQEKQQVETPTPQLVFTRSNSKCSKQGRRGSNRSDESIRGINNVTSTEEIAALSRLKSICSKRLKAVFSSPKKFLSTDKMSTGNNLPPINSIENKSAPKRTNQDTVTTTASPKLSDNVMSNDSEEREHNIASRTEQSELLVTDDVAQEKQLVEKPKSQPVSTRSNNKCLKQGRRCSNRSDESIGVINNTIKRSEFLASDDATQEEQQVENPIPQSVSMKSNSKCSKQGSRGITQSCESINGINNTTLTAETAALSRSKSISSERSKVEFPSSKDLHVNSMLTNTNFPPMGSIKKKSYRKHINQGEAPTTINQKLSKNAMSNNDEEKENSIAYKTEQSKLLLTDEVSQEEELAEKPKSQPVSTRSNRKKGKGSVPVHDISCDMYRTKQVKFTYRTKLFKLVGGKKWEETIQRCVDHPQEASLYSDSKVIENPSSILPIYLAIVQHAPAEVIEALVNSYPDGPKICDDRKMLPLHIAFRLGASPETAAVLVSAYPGALTMKDSKGHTPLQILKAYRREYKKEKNENKCVSSVIDKNRKHLINIYLENRTCRNYNTSQVNTNYGMVERMIHDSASTISSDSSGCKLADFGRLTVDSFSKISSVLRDSTSC